MKDKIVEAVCNDLNYRSSVGIKKYGTTLDRDDYQLKDWLQHAYEETLDNANYLKAALMQDRKILRITKPMFIQLVKLLQTSPDRSNEWIHPEYNDNLYKAMNLLAKALDEEKWSWIEWWCYDNDFGKRGLDAEIFGKEVKTFDQLVEALYN